MASLHPPDAVQGFGCPQQAFCKAKMVFVYTKTLLAGAMKPLNVLSKFENHFAIRTVRFQVQLEADGYFSARKIFRICNRRKQGELVPTRNFLNLFFTNPASKHLLGFAQTQYSAQNCADCVSQQPLNKQIFSEKICFSKIRVDSFNIASNRNYYFRF